MSEGLDLIVEQFSNSFQSASASLAHAGTNLAYWLAAISLTISISLMIIQGDGLERGFSKLLQTCLLFGMFFGLIHLGGEWIPAMLNTFMQLGGQSANLSSLSPNSIFQVGVSISGKLFGLIWELGITGIPTALMAMICGCFVLIIYCFIAAELTINLVKAYALVTVGPIIFALGNSDFTRSAVTNYVRKIIGMGLQIMMIYIIIGVGVSMGNEWIAAFRDIDSFRKFGMQGLMPVAGGLVVLYLVLKNVPAFIAEIAGAGGFRNYGDAAIAAAAGGATAITNAVIKSSPAMGAGAKGLYRGGRAGGQGAKQWYDKVSDKLGGNDKEAGRGKKAFAKGIGGVAGAFGIPGGMASASGKVSWDYAKKHINSVRGYLGGRSIDT